MATSSTISITCPTWCTVPKWQHVADLDQMDGYVIHWSASDAGIRLSSCTTPDGTQDPAEPPAIWFDFNDESVSTERASKIATAILERVEEARA